MMDPPTSRPSSADSIAALSAANISGHRGSGGTITAAMMEVCAAAGRWPPHALGMADAVAANFRPTAQGASYGRSADDYDKITPKFHPGDVPVRRGSCHGAPSG